FAKRSGRSFRKEQQEPEMNDEELNDALQRLSAQMDQPEIREWLSIRKEAGKMIAPQTAEVTWWHAQTLDPYGVCDDFPKECDSIGREYFARAPGGDIWVSFSDLPEPTRNVL